MTTVHHLQNSRSMRVIWLMEELGVDYELKVYERAPQTSLAPADYRALHPLGKAPIVTDGDTVLAETGAIVEYFLEKYPDAGLQPPPGTPERVKYQYWMHTAEGSLMPLLMMQLFFNRMENEPPFPIKQMVRMVTGKVRGFYLTPSLTNLLTYINDELGKSTYFAGETLTGADIMMSFPLEAATARGGMNDSIPHVLSWLERIHAHPAYKRAEEKGGKTEIIG